MTIPSELAVFISYYEITLWILWSGNINKCQALVRWSTRKLSLYVLVTVTLLTVKLF